MSQFFLEASMALTYLEAFGTCLELNFWNSPGDPQLVLGT